MFNPTLNTQMFVLRWGRVRLNIFIAVGGNVNVSFSAPIVLLVAQFFHWGTAQCSEINGIEIHGP